MHQRQADLRRWGVDTEGELLLRRRRHGLLPPPRHPRDGLQGQEGLALEVVPGHFVVVQHRHHEAGPRGPALLQGHQAGGEVKGEKGEGGGRRGERDGGGRWSKREGDGANVGGRNGRVGGRREGGGGGRQRKREGGGREVEERGRASVMMEEGR